MSSLWGSLYEARRAEIIVIKPLKQNHRNPEGEALLFKYYMLPTKIDIEPYFLIMDFNISPLSVMIFR